MSYHYVAFLECLNVVLIIVVVLSLAWMTKQAVMAALTRMGWVLEDDSLRRIVVRLLLKSIRSLPLHNSENALMISTIIANIVDLTVSGAKPEPYLHLLTAILSLVPILQGTWNKNVIFTYKIDTFCLKRYLYLYIYQRSARDVCTCFLPWKSSQSPRQNASGSSKMNILPRLRFYSHRCQ